MVAVEAGARASAGAFPLMHEEHHNTAENKRAEDKRKNDADSQLSTISLL